MQSYPKLKKNIARYGSKAVVLGVLLALMFSPFGGISQTQVAQAADDICIKYIGNGILDTRDTKLVLADGTCPGGGYKKISVASLNELKKQESVNGLVDTDANDNSCNSFASCIADVVYLFTVGLGSAVAYVGAWIFSLAVALSLSSTAYALTFISEGWGIVRDMANMFFILVLVFIALTIMFKADTHNTMKQLAWVIVIALLINFSFFFTRVVIDTGNLLAVQFYNAIKADPMGATATNSGLQGAAARYLGPGAETKDLTSSIMKGVGVHNILGTPAFKAFAEENTGVGGFFATLITLSFLYIALGAMLFMLAAAFFTVGIKFIVRIVVLWLLIIASPAALIANTVQQGKKYYTQWQDALIQYAFYPAVFLFIFYILTLFTEDLTNDGATDIIQQTFFDLSKITGGGLAYLAPLVATIAIRLGFVIALLYIGLQVSEKMGVMGAKFAQNITGRAFGFVGGATAWSTGLLARNTVGRGFNRLAQSPRMATGAQQTGVRGFLWRRAEGGTRRLAAASYDMRNVPGAGLLRQGMEKIVGNVIKTGKPSGEGGIAKSMKEREEKQDRERKERAAIIRDAANREAIERLSAAHTAGAPASPQDTDRVKNFTKRELEKVQDRHLEVVAHAITESQLKTFSESDKFTDIQKERVRLEFQERNPNSPLVKGQNIVINELRQLNGRLVTIGVPIVNTHSASGATISATHVNDMVTQVNNTMATLNSNIRSAPRGANTSGLQRDLLLLRNAIRSLERVEEERKKVTPNPSATPSRVNPGEFVVP